MEQDNSITGQDSSIKPGISVLIPNYNHVCVSLVGSLSEQLLAEDVPYEIIVAEDGSTDREAIVRNGSLASSTPSFRHIVRTENAGRAAIRNFLAREAAYDRLLFIDSDTEIPDGRFIRRYLDAGDSPVVNGGVRVDGDPEALHHNLRYRYEKAAEGSRTAAARNAHPHQEFRSTNFLIRRETMLQHPFDERFRHYGYEDVLLGKTLHRQHIPVTHIDNPVSFCSFEPNVVFVGKTEEGLRTLHQFQDDLRGYSRLLTFVAGIHIPAVITLLRLWHKTAGRLERRLLCSRHPSLLVFKLYRIGYFLSLS